MKRLCTVMIVLALAMVITGTASAQTPITDEVIVSILDESGQPAAGIVVKLILREYGDLGIKEVTMGSCTTDATGQCSILATDPPHLEDGWIEGYLVIGDGRQVLGWYMGVGTKQVTLQLLGGGLATVAAPLDGPYEEQTQQPTDGSANLPTATLTRTPRPTSTSTPKPTDTQQPTATDAPASTEPSAPTATVAVVVAGSNNSPSTSVPLLLVVIIGATAAACVALFSLVIVFLRHRKRQKEQRLDVLGAVSSLTVAAAMANGAGTSLDVVNKPAPETSTDNDKPQQDRA